MASDNAPGAGPLRVVSLNWSFGRQRVLRDLSFSVEPGEIIGIAGPNGCGKTTLLRLATGLLPAPEGTVFFDGEDVGAWRRRALAQRAAYVPQFFDHSFAFTAYDSVMMGRHPHLGRLDREGSRDHAITRAAMESASVWELREQLVPQLSGGEAQRVVLARSLAQTPGVLFADEPTAHLDIHHQLKVLELLRGINRENGTTIVAVLHDLNHALALCDRVLLLAQGRVHGIGSPEEVLTPESIREVYGIEAEIARSRFTGRPTIIPRIDVA